MSKCVKDSSVYIMFLYDDLGLPLFVKIGVSRSNAAARVRDFQTGNPFKLLARDLYFYSYRRACYIEKLAHKFLEERNLWERREWFKYNRNALKELLKSKIWKSRRSRANMAQTKYRDLKQKQYDEFRKKLHQTAN